MKNNLESKLPNADMQAAPRALLRASLRAREIARQTKTQLVVVIDGVLREVDPDDKLEPVERARRAEHARRAYFTRLALKSAQSRRARQQQ